jgi:hypothetical protein
LYRLVTGHIQRKPLDRLVREISNRLNASRGSVDFAVSTRKLLTSNITPFEREPASLDDKLTANTRFLQSCTR